MISVLLEQLRSYHFPKGYGEQSQCLLENVIRRKYCKMQSLLEKITLYDILGYLFPGTVFETILAFTYIAERYYLGKKNELICMGKMLDHVQSYIPALIIISGYLLGIIISELSDVLDKILTTAIKKISKVKFLKFLSLKENEYGITEEILKRALINSGICTENEINSTLQINENKTLQDLYGRTMYGMLQNDEKYKRIHNYGSGQLMNRNLSYTLIFAGVYIVCRIIVLKISVVRIFLFGLFYLVMIYAVYKRYRKMSNRKSEYVRIWFVEKYKR